MAEENVLGVTTDVTESKEFKQFEREEMTPTLLIGLGGTGKLVLTRLKARFIEQFGSVPPIVRFLLFDIDPKEETSVLDSQEVKLSTAEEFIDIGNVPARDIKEAVHEGVYPELQAWFNKDISLAEDNLRRGGQQNRQLGRLALYWHLRTRGGLEYIEKAVSELTKQAALARPGQPDSERPLEVNVYIIASLCGGTGSGMFIDVAYLTQDVFKQRGMADNARIIGVFITPKVFSNVPQENIQPNALAALQELDYFMTQRSEEKKSQTIRYLGGREVKCVERPFRICYLVDAISSGGRNIEGIENALPMLVDAIFLLVGSRIGERAAGLINNVKTVNTPPTVYSTFGVASLVFPVRQIIGICAARVGQEVIRDVLLAPVSDLARTDLNKELDRFIADNNFDTKHLFDLLSKDEKGVPAMGRLKNDDRLRDNHLAQIDVSNLYSYVVTRVTEIGAELDHGSRRHLERKRDKAVQDFIENPRTGLHPKIREYVNTPERGLNYTIEFLTTLRERLNALYTDLEGQRSTLDQQRTSAEKVRQTLQSKFEKTARDAQRPILGFFSRGRRLRQAREDYIGASQRLLEAGFNTEVYVQAKMLVSRAMEEVDQLAERLRTLAGNLKWAQEVLFVEKERSYQNGINNLDAVRSKAITTKEDIEKLYVNNKADARHKVIQEVLSSEGGLYELSKQRREQVGDRIFKVAGLAFRKLLDMRLEDIILEKERGDSPIPREEWMESLRGSAETFWSYRKARDVAEDRISEFIQITGVENTQKSIFSTKVRKVGEDFVSTGDRHTITVLRMEHGLAFKTMSQYDTYLNAYAQAMRKDWPIHVFPEFNYGTKKDKRIFIVAYAYGFIRKIGARYVYVPDEGGQEIPLTEKSDTRGLLDAVWRFANNRELVNTVADRLEAYQEALERQGKEKELIASLESFAKQLRFSDTDSALGAVLKQLLQEHIEEVRRAQM